MGIKPKSVAKKNLLNGTFKTGELMLIKKLGTIGVILKNNK